MTVTSLLDFPSVAAYLHRIEAEPRGLKTAVVREVVQQYWRDIAQIKFTKSGEVSAPEKYMPEPEEAVRIKDEMSSAKWPEIVLSRDLEDLPAELQNVNPENLFEFRDEQGFIIMIQVRRDLRDGGKTYLPYTRYDTGWVCAEPDDRKLPLWGIPSLKDQSSCFIVEGAKSGRALERLINPKTPEEVQAAKEHPWHEALQNAAVVAFIGGALAASRTDWTPILKAGIKNVYIWNDHDTPGLSAVPEISKQMKAPTFHLQLTDSFPVSFDAADPWPSKLFKHVEGRKVYTGPTFQECLQPATWAADRFETLDEVTGKKKVTWSIRPAFRQQWTWVEKADMWVNNRLPNIVRTKEILDSMSQSFGQYPNVSKLMLNEYLGRVAKITYTPASKDRILFEDGEPAINLYEPSPIKAVEGDPQVFLDFAKHLIPDEKERHEVLKWTATLIARPEIRMLYGVLMVSERQGQGKSVYGRILEKVVGTHNTVTPAEQTITNGTYNAWIAKKRLVICAELYAGSSWKAYNTLKSLITDDTVHISEKYEKGYQLKNWAHFFACSNSLEVLKIEESDRRWLYPELSETAWPKENFNKLFDWLEADGYGIVKYWAENLWTDYVQPNDSAPSTKRKTEAIENSRSPGQNAAIDLARVMDASKEPIAVTMNDVMLFIHQQYQYGEKSYDRPLGVKKAMKEGGVIWSKERISVNSRTQNLGFNETLREKMKGLAPEEALRMAKDYVRLPSQLMEERF